MPEISVTSLPPRLHRQVDSARTALDRGNPEYAVNLCREILREHPGCLPVRRLQRAAHQRIFRARHPLIGRLLGELVAAPLVTYGRLLAGSAPRRALAAADRALGLMPSHGGALVLLSRAASALDLPETAAFALEALCESRPADGAVLVRVADAYIAAGRTAEAVAIADRLLKARPADLDLQRLAKRASVADSIAAGKWDSGSGTYRDKLRDEGAAVLLEQAAKAVNSTEMTARLVDEAVARIALEPGNLNHYRGAITGLRAMGRLEEAIEWIERARALPVGKSDANLEKLEGDLRIAVLDRRVKARRVAVGQAGGDPDADPDVRRMAGELSALRISILRRLVEKYPSELSYKHELGLLLLASGSVDAAIEQFQIARRNPKLRLDAMTALGAAFQAKGLHDLAVQQLESVKEELPVFDDAKKEVVYRLASCFEAMGRGDRALEEYKLIYSADIRFRDVAAKIDGYYSRS